MARVTTEGLVARLAKGKPVPAIFLLGDEPYLRDSCRALLIGKYVPEEARAWAVSRFSAADGETIAALSQAQTLPMLSPQQLVFLEDVQAIEDLGDKKREVVAKAIEAYLANPAPFTTLVLEASALDQRMRLAKLLAEKTLVVVVSLGEESGPRRASAVVEANRLAAEIGVKLDSGVADELSDLVADNLLQMKMELEKLAAHAGEARRVRREDVAALVVSNKKSTVWAMAGMIAGQQREAALEFLDRLLRDGEEPVRMVGALAWMYRKLIETQEIKGPVNAWQVTRQLGMQQETTEIALSNAPRISRARLLSGISALQECDDRLKGGSRDARAALDFLIARLAAPPKAVLPPETAVLPTKRLSN
jgi:DNA polymerase-3 subunit delta